MRDILLVMVFAALVPMTFLRPWLGILGWCWISYFSPHRLTYSFASTLLPYAAIIGVTTLAAWLLSPREPKRIPLTGSTVLLLVFWAWCGVTTLFAFNADAPLGLEQCSKIFLMTVVTAPLIRTRDRLIVLVAVIAGSVGFYGLKGGLFALATGGQNRVWGPENTFIEDNNQLAVALLMVLPMMLFLARYVSRPWVGRAIGGAALLTFAAVLSTYSRGALVAIAAVAVFLWWRSNRKLLYGVLISLTLAVGLASMPDTWSKRMSTIDDYNEDASAQGRLEMWTFAFNVANDRPLLGGGFNVFAVKELYPIYNPQASIVRSVHSIWFQVLGEHGYVGLALFLALLASAYRNFGWVMRNARGSPDMAWAVDLAGMLQCSLIAYCVGGTFLNLAFFDLPYHIVIISVVLRRLVGEAVPAKVMVPQAAQPRSTCGGGHDLAAGDGVRRPV